MTSLYRSEDSTSNALKRINVDVLGTTFDMSYADIGPREGPIIMCFHGSPATYRAFHTMFEPLTDAGFRLILPNLPGMGYTDIDKNKVFNFSHQHKVKLIEGLIKELKLQRIEMVIGHSLGGHLAGHVAANNDIFKSVGFLCGPGVTMHYKNWLVPNYLYLQHIKLVGLLLNFGVNIPIVGNVILYVVKVAYKQIGLMGKTPISNVYSIREASQMDFKQFHEDIKDLRKRKVPVLQIYCEDDEFIKPNISLEVGRILGMGEGNTIRYNPQGERCNLQGITDDQLHRVVVFEEGGHRPHWKWTKAVSHEIISMVKMLSNAQTQMDTNINALSDQLISPSSNL